MIGIGLDIGSVAAKGILLDGDEEYRVLLPTGWSPRGAGEAIIKELLDLSSLQRTDLHQIVVTGYGRVALSSADQTVTEIKCHARGVSELYPEVRTIVDIGGQDSKVIHVGTNGKVLDFAMNDKCAAGTGPFLQVMATAMGMDVSELGQNEDAAQTRTINSMCTVFAESEIIGLRAQGLPIGGIIAGLHQSVGKRVGAMARRLGIKEPIAFTGGVAINAGVKRALEEEIGCSLLVPADCQFTGALGAALLACNR